MWFDIFSGYLWGKWAGTLDEKKWLTRIIFLETVAGVPGMVTTQYNCWAGDARFHDTSNPDCNPDSNPDWL